ncbi:hypothetical protein F5B20DRAFT_532769 [Whalleya microplaca]|nr:hypothetical protein F5B20DRAFT_532769 [Whalleya microplaca]
MLAKALLISLYTIVTASSAAVAPVPRDLAKAHFSYQNQGACCFPVPGGSQQCGGGDKAVKISATADTGNSYEATLNLPGPNYPNGFDGKQHCDKGGIICWSATKKDEYSGNVCVYYANTKSCADWTAKHETKPFCFKSVSISQQIAG